MATQLNEMRLDERSLADTGEAPLLSVLDSPVDLDETIVDALPLFERRRLSREAGELDIGDDIGRGGTAIVSEAREASLRRVVAVKRVRHPSDRPAEVRLVREARVLAALDHPNVVPVYRIGLDDVGRPLIVMKRVDGTPWSSYVGEGGCLSAPTRGDALEWHLRVLMQVAATVQFAHDRGVLHRDIKLDNVMIGDAGELYLVDWDLAVRLGEEVQLDIPGAWEETEVVGTPGAMAPEMALAQGRFLGPTSDVYLLGSCLHRLLTGKPRHAGRNVVRRLYAASKSHPVQYDTGVPLELARIANRATMRSPRDRYSSAAVFLDAVQRFLDQRGALRLCMAADHRLDELETLVGTTDDMGRQRFHRLVGECRFGFRLACEEWADSEEARQGQRRLQMALIDDELQVGSTVRAAALISELDVAPGSLLRRLAARRRLDDDDALERTRLAALDRDTDASVGLRERSGILLAISAGWATAFAALALAVRAGLIEPGYGTFAGLITLHSASIGVAMFAHRRIMDANRVNRRFALTLAFSGFGLVMLWPLLMVSGLAFHHAVALLDFTLMVCCVMAVISLDVRFLVGAVGYGVAALLTMAVPDLKLELIGLATLIGMGSVGLAWRREVDPPPARSKRGSVVRRLKRLMPTQPGR